MFHSFSKRKMSCAVNIHRRLLNSLIPISRQFSSVSYNHIILNVNSFFPFNFRSTKTKSHHWHWIAPKRRMLSLMLLLLNSLQHFLLLAMTGASVDWLWKPREIISALERTCHGWRTLGTWAKKRSQLTPWNYVRCFWDVISYASLHSVLWKEAVSEEAWACAQPPRT